MDTRSYSTTIKIVSPPKLVFDSINNVPAWWSKDFEGSSTKLNDEFIINHPGRHYSKQKLVELVPYKKVVWLVTDSTLNWLERDQQEWTGTSMIFELSPEGDGTVLHFTHEGLTPAKECYERCTGGWNMVIKEWLYNLINNTKF